MWLFICNQSTHLGCRPEDENIEDFHNHPFGGHLSTFYNQGQSTKPVYASSVASYNWPRDKLQLTRRGPWVVLYTRLGHVPEDVKWVQDGTPSGRYLGGRARKLIYKTSATDQHYVSNLLRSCSVSNVKILYSSQMRTVEVTFGVLCCEQICSETESSRDTRKLTGLDPIGETARRCQRHFCTCLVKHQLLIGWVEKNSIGFDAVEEK